MVEVMWVQVGGRQGRASAGLRTTPQGCRLPPERAPCAPEMLPLHLFQLPWDPPLPPSLLCPCLFSQTRWPPFLDPGSEVCGE